MGSTSDSCDRETQNNSDKKKKQQQNNKDIMASALLETNELEGLAKEELIALVMELQNERNELVGQLERNEVPCCSRSNSVEVMNNDVVEEEGVMNLFNGAKVEVYGRQLKRKDVAACHRIGKRAVTCKVREG